MSGAQQVGALKEAFYRPHAPNLTNLLATVLPSTFSFLELQDATL